MLPSDSNHSTDELLRAYARQRRGEAGAPLEMDAATRRFLQAEVSRQFRRASGEADSWFALLPFLGRRLLWGGVGVVLLLIAGGLWLRFDSQREEKLARAQEDRLLVFARSPADHSAPQRGAEPSLPERVRRFQLGDSDRQSSEIAGAPPQSKAEEPTSAVVRRAAPETGRVDLAFATRNETEMFSNAPRFQFGLPPPPRGGPLPRPRQVESPAKAPAGEAVLAQAGERLGVSTQIDAPKAQALVALADNFAAQSPAGGRMAKGLPATGPAAQSQFGVSGARQDQQRFYFQQVDPQTRYRRNLNSPPAPKVLTAFEMQQNGQNLRIVDADGSVYDGVIEPTVSQAQNRALLTRYGLARQPAAAPVPPGPAGAMQAAPTQSQPVVEVPSETQAVIQTAVANQATPVQSFSFRVMGTNRILNERVEFEGEFEPGTDAASNQVAAGAEVSTQALGVNLVQQANEPKLSDQLQTVGPTQAANTLANVAGGRIEGRASVGGKSRFRIEAQQVDR